MSSHILDLKGKKKTLLESNKNEREGCLNTKKNLFCVTAARLGEECEYDDACAFSDDNTACVGGKCDCIDGFRAAQHLKGAALCLPGNIQLSIELYTQSVLCTIYTNATFQLHSKHGNVPGEQLSDDHDQCRGRTGHLHSTPLPRAQVIQQVRDVMRNIFVF
ncbi:EB domain-containing protein [Trichonephila inaurata madagascariensis]|uniref:EB domain-containing protein n=1 Tax=Trichonephila inaurata madagascariensis TaxID=2747483 RepID=A0A8X7BSH1_9ARAC|nr:EB domain-containing protein [Trichonephila inaurata madagascariensis]